jgi:hypothetical protein
MLRTLVPLRRTVATAVFVVGLSAASAGAQSATLNFEGLRADPAVGVRYVPNCYTEAGFTVAAVGLTPPCTSAGVRDPDAFITGSPESPLFYPGSVALGLNDENPGVTGFLFTRNGGGLFSVASISFAPFLGSATTVSVFGIRTSGPELFATLPVITGNLLTTFSSQFATFTDLSALRITAMNANREPYFFVDNATFTVGATSVIPEPATVALFATGLVGLGAFARRRRAAA